MIVKDEEQDLPRLLASVRPHVDELCIVDTGNLELAEGRFQQCLTLDEADGFGGSSAEQARTWGPAYHLAVLRECLGMPEDAREWYERALAFRPDHTESLAGLARLQGGRDPIGRANQIDRYDSPAH